MSANHATQLGSVSEETITELAAQLAEPDWLTDRRMEALAALPDLDLPSVIQTPGRRWTNLEELDFDQLVDPLDHGVDQEYTAPDAVNVMSLREAFDTLEPQLKEHFGTVIDPTANYLTALSTVLFSTGTVVHVPEGVSGEDITIRTAMSSQSLFNYTLVIAEESSEVTILERQSSAESPVANRLYSGLVEIVAGANSSVQYGNLQDLDERTYHYTLKRGSVTRDATVTWIEANLGGRLTKSAVESDLDGEGAETNIVGAFFGHGDQHFDISSRVRHNDRHTTADLVTRGVLDDHARSAYEGVQHVAKEAWHTSSYQRENTLMLSDESEADASPKLIINNHETEASHSATVGQVDQEELFYLTSRGLDKQTAINLLVEGFFEPVFDEIAVTELEADLQARIIERLP